MKNGMKIYYDEEGDIFELQVGKPRKGQYQEIEDGIFVRKDKGTNEVIGIMIMAFKKRSVKMKDININLPFKIEVLPES